MRQPPPSSSNIWLLVVVVSVIFYVLYTTVSFVYKNQSIRQEITSIETQNQRLKEQIKARQQQIKYLSTPQRVDKEAKMQLGKSRPGEKIIVVVRPEKEWLPVPQIKPPEWHYEQLPNWKKWLWIFWGE